MPLPPQALKPTKTPTERLFYGLMVGMGVVCSAIILLVLFVLTTSLDRSEVRDDSYRLTQALEKQTQALVQAAQTYARRDDVYRAATSQVPDAALPDVGLTPNGTHAFDWLAVLDTEGHVLRDAALSANKAAADLFDSSDFQAALAELSGHPPGDQGTIVGAYKVNGVRFLAATLRIMPDELADPDTTALPYFVGGRAFDASALRTLANSTGTANLAFRDTPTDHAIAIQGPSGSVGYLTWQPDLPGTQFRKAALPWVLTMCTAIVFLSAWAATYFRKLVKGLERMRRVAATDDLTGIANRTALTHALQTPALQKALIDGSVAAISLDLDDFKMLNDSHGHHVGDIALRVTADHIRASTRRSDLVFRIGGDEFLCLIIDAEPEGAAQKVVGRLNTAFRTPMDLGGLKHFVRPSIGVAIATPGEDWSTVMARSDAAMYRAKRGDGHEIFCPALRSA